MYNSERLLSPDLDVEAYLRYALHSSSLTSELARLTGCLGQVKEDMQGILADHADGMVRQLQASHTAQRDIGAARQSVDSLKRATDRLRFMIEDPYKAIQGKLTELENTNVVVDILRDVLKFTSLSSRLQEVMANTGASSSSSGSTNPSVEAKGGFAGEVDVTRAARTLKELEDLCMTADIRGIEVVEARMRIVEKFSTTIRHRIHELLSVSRLLDGPAGSAASAASGDNSGDIAPPVLNRVVLDMGTALQCAYTLGSLTKVVHGFMMERKREALKAIMRELDVQSIAEQAANASAVAPSGSSPTGGGSGGANGVLRFTQDALLARIQGALFTVVQQTQWAVLLWRVLLRRQDALTQTPIFRALESPVQVLLEYWNAVMEKLRERLVALQQRNDFEAALTAGFPRFRQLLDSLLSSSGELAGAAGFGATGSGGGAQGSSSSAIAVATAASLPEASCAPLLLLKVSQWGLGDYMDLVQLVDAVSHGSSTSGDGGGAARGGAYELPSAASVETLKSTWVSLVADDLQKRFAARLMDRHWEKMNPILSRLAAITPASVAVGGQSVSVSAADARRGMLPAAATALDVSSYTRLALQDCYLYRQDPLALRVAVQCVLSATQQLLSRLRECTSKHPLPPLPAVTTSVTRTQLMHVCIVNACTTLVNDLASTMAFLPDAATAGGGGASDARSRSAGAGSSADLGPISTTVELGKAHNELRTILEAFRTISENSSQPFLSSARETLLPAVSDCVDVATSASLSADNRAVLQLQRRLDVFLNNYFLLVDPRTSDWADGTRRLADALMARLLARCATITLTGETALATVTPAFNRALAGCLQEASIVILSFASATQSAVMTGTTSATHKGDGGSGGVGRSTLMLKGAAKQTELFYTTVGSRNRPDGGGGNACDGPEGRLIREMHTILRPLYPPLARFLLVQQLHQPPPPARPAVLEDAVALTRVLEQGLMAFCECAPPARAALADPKALLPPHELARRAAEAMDAAETYVRLLVEANSAGACHGHLAEVWRLL